MRLVAEQVPGQADVGPAATHISLPLWLVLWLDIQVQHFIEQGDQFQEARLLARGQVDDSTRKMSQERW